MGSLACGLVYAADVTDQKIQQDQDQLKSDYQKKIDHELKVLGGKIKHLQHQTDAKLNADLKKQNRKLAIKNAETKQKLEELKKSTGDAWKDLRKGVDDALTDLKVSVDEASRKYKTAPTATSR